MGVAAGRMAATVAAGILSGGWLDDEDAAPPPDSITGEPIIYGEPWANGALEVELAPSVGTPEAGSWDINEELDGSGAWQETGDADQTYLVNAEGVIGMPVSYLQTAGTASARSSSVTLERVGGITRAALVDDYYARGAGVTITAAGTILVRWVGFAIEGTLGRIVSWGGVSGASSGARAIELGISTASGVRVSGTLRNGTTANAVLVDAANALDGSTVYWFALRWNATGSVFDVAVIPSGGSLVSAAGTYVAPTGGTGTRIPTLGRRAVQLCTGLGLPQTHVAGTFEAVALAEVLSDATLSDLALGNATMEQVIQGTLASTSWLGVPGDIYEGDDVFSSFEGPGQDWGAVAGPGPGAAALTWGGLNVAIPAP